MFSIFSSYITQPWPLGHASMDWCRLNRAALARFMSFVVTGSIVPLNITCTWRITQLHWDLHFTPQGVQHQQIDCVQAHRKFSTGIVGTPQKFCIPMKQIQIRNLHSLAAHAAVENIRWLSTKPGIVPTPVLSDKYGVLPQMTLVVPVQADHFHTFFHMTYRDDTNQIH